MALSDAQMTAITDRQTRIDQALASVVRQQGEIKSILTAGSTPPPPPPPPSGDWLKRITQPRAAVTGPSNLPDVPSTYSGKKLTVQQMMEHGWNAGFRTAEDLQILAAISLAESGGDIGCRNWHPEFGFKTSAEPEHLMMAVPLGVRNGSQLMRSDRGAWQISDHFYPGCWDAECDDPAIAAKMVKWIKDNRGGWSQWDTYADGSYKNKVTLATAQAFVNGPH